MPLEPTKHAVITSDLLLYCFQLLRLNHQNVTVPYLLCLVAASI
jgi:hypothetical protein